MSPWSNQSWKHFSSNKCRPAQLVSAVTLDGSSPRWISNLNLHSLHGCFKALGAAQWQLDVWSPPQPEWAGGRKVNRADDRLSYNESSLFAQQLFWGKHNKRPTYFPPTFHPPPRSWEADIGWAASLGFHMSTGQNSFPEVMDVSGLVSSCHLSSYRLGYFHNDVDLWLKVSQSSGSAYQFKTAHFSLISLSDCAWGEKCADWLLFAWVVSNCTHNGKHVQDLSRNNMQHVWDTSDDPDVSKLVHQSES